MLWFAYGNSCRWSSGASSYVMQGGAFDPTDHPVGDPYTLAWYAYFKMDVRAYTKSDENQSDTNVYLKVTLTTQHNKVWSSNDTAHQEGFVDVGAIVWNSTPPLKKQPYSFEGGFDGLLYDQDGAIRQLYDWAGVNDNNVVCGIVGDNGQMKAKTMPVGSWGTHNGTDSGALAPREFTLVYPESCFNNDGQLKEEFRKPPFAWVHRGRQAVLPLADLYVEDTIQINLDIDPFIYIPWAIRKSGEYLTCNRREDGLTVYKNGGFNKVVTNSILSIVVGNNFPNNSNGFRIHNNKWEVSPITPDGD